MFRSSSSLLRALHAFAAVSALLLLSVHARAYPWMIRHEYAQCSACHVDPSGAGPTTQYGRDVGKEGVYMNGAGEGAVSSDFLLGVVKTPDWLQLGGDLRVMSLGSKTRGVPSTQRTIWMQLDADASLSLGDFVASGALGYAPQGALGAALTRSTAHNLVSRQHWLGYKFAAAANLFIRAGRMNLPFGIRTIEHTLWARKLTRTNINDEQQYGLSAYFAGEMFRAELMGIAGSLQLRPDDYRERGYSGYFELEPLSGAALGVSSLITHRDLDTVTLEETWRQVHGAFGRWATPYQPLVLLTEWDYVFESARNNFYKRGLVSYLQADWEPLLGMHFMLTGEAAKVGSRERHWSYGGWLTYAWFPAPHLDVRLDGIYQSLGSAAGRDGVYTLLLQGHVSL
jgi:hypothetical protein